VGTAGVPPARPPLRWQPPPPGVIARYRAKRRYGREIARGQRVSPSRGPLVLIGLMATLILFCAIGGALIGFSTGPGAGGAPPPVRPTPHPAVSTHPKPKPTTTRPRPKPTGTHRS
jgi:hypothetical protein